MTDTEKVALIGMIISDFWEYNNEEKITIGAEAIVTAINSVVVFESKEQWQIVTDYT